jgi:hypothetical protein
MVVRRGGGEVEAVKLVTGDSMSQERKASWWAASRNIRAIFDREGASSVNAVSSLNIMAHYPATIVPTSFNYPKMYQTPVCAFGEVA